VVGKKVELETRNIQEKGRRKIMKRKLWDMRLLIIGLFMFVQAGFVFAEKKGRTRLLKLAPKFFDYFDVVENEVKSKIVSNEVAKIEQETKTIEDSLKTAEKNNAEGSDAEEDEDLNVKKEKKGEDHETKIT